MHLCLNHVGQETTNYVLEPEISDLRQIDPFYVKIQKYVKLCI